MDHVRTTISFKGFTEAQVRDGLHHLADAFQRRPWLVRTDAFWDRSRNRLVVMVESKGNNADVFGGSGSPEADEPSRDGGANYDEITECVDACITCSEAIHIRVDQSVLVTRFEQEGVEHGKNRDFG